MSSANSLISILFIYFIFIYYPNDNPMMSKRGPRFLLKIQILFLQIISILLKIVCASSKQKKKLKVLCESLEHFAVYSGGSFLATLSLNLENPSLKFSSYVGMKVAIPNIFIYLLEIIIFSRTNYDSSNCIILLFPLNEILTQRLVIVELAFETDLVNLHI